MLSIFSTVPAFTLRVFLKICNLDFVHDGTTRPSWAFDRLAELLEEPQDAPNTLPNNFINVLRELMDQDDADEENEDRLHALMALNKPLRKEGYEAFYGEDRLLYVRHIGTKTVSNVAHIPHRPLSPKEIQRRELLTQYLKSCSEDELIEEVLLPLFRQLGYHRISATGHKDKALEYGKDIWMRYILPTQHVLYFGLQVKKGKLNSAGNSKGSDSNISEIYNQLLMMIGHEIFDPETNKRALVDHALIVAGGEITKQARNWLGQRLDALKRSQIFFMDRDDILNLYTVSSLPLPSDAVPEETKIDNFNDEMPF